MWSTYNSDNLFFYFTQYILEENIYLCSGLILSIILMATAASLISRWIKEYKWIAWLGLLAILAVAIELIYTDIKILFL